MKLEVLYQKLSDTKRAERELERRIAVQTGTSYLEKARWIPQTQVEAGTYFACQWCGSWVHGEDVPNYRYCPFCGKEMLTEADSIINKKEGN